MAVRITESRHALEKRPHNLLVVFAQRLNPSREVLVERKRFGGILGVLRSVVRWATAVAGVGLHFAKP